MHHMPLHSLSHTLFSGTFINCFLRMAVLSLPPSSIFYPLLHHPFRELSSIHTLSLSLSLPPSQTFSFLVTFSSNFSSRTEQCFFHLSWLAVKALFSYTEREREGAMTASSYTHTCAHTCTHTHTHMHTHTHTHTHTSHSPPSLPSKIHFHCPL